MVLANTQVFYDEEECLGFGVFVAELELVVGTSKGRKPDQAVLLELLQKLHASITATRDTAILRQHQKRCEAALYEVLYKGCCNAVCNLVYICLSRLYKHGDLLPLYSQLAAMQAFLQDKNSTAPEAIRLSVMGLLAHLELNMGRCVASSALESMAIAAKAAKGSSVAMKAAGLKLAAAVVEGLPQHDRNMSTVQAEAWKLFEKQIKDKAREELRAAAAGLLSALCRAGGYVLWNAGGFNAEEALKATVSALEDAATQPLRESYVLALAELAVSAQRSNPCLVAALEAEKRPAKRQQLERCAGGMFKAALVNPFVEAAVAGNQAVTSALALGWCSYAGNVPAAEPDALVDLAIRALAMLEQCSKAAAESAMKYSAPDAFANVGACLSGGEMPAVSAAVIYIIRTAVISKLQEPGQRQLLSALATAASHAIAPPVIVAAMEGCGVLLELLGEIHDEGAVKAVQNAATSKLSASSTAVRHQAAAVVAALALSSPPLLAKLFGECLEGVETFCQQLMLMAAPYTKKGCQPSIASPITRNSTGTGTPRGAPDSQTKHCIDGLHGNALAVGALLVASARSALGAPSRLTSTVFWIAKRMISQPYCSCTWAVAAEREAGYILLGCMCAAAAPSLLTGATKQQQILELFSIALGPTAAEALASSAATAGEGAGDNSEPGPGDLDVAVACWWRAAALQALSAYVMGVMGRGLAEDPAQQVRLIAAMLSPLLEVLVTNPNLGDPVSSVGSAGSSFHTGSAPGSTAASPVPGSALSPRPTVSGGGAAGSSSTVGAAPLSMAHGGVSVSPVTAAAAALLQLRMLEVFFFLPAAQLWANCHEDLLQLCCRQLLGVGGSRVSQDAAACIAVSSLKHMVNSQDALLGPWLPGRDMLEDELRTFVGAAGAPQQHPWEVGAAFTAGFITYSQALLPPESDSGVDDMRSTCTAQAASNSPSTSSNRGRSPLSPTRSASMQGSSLLQHPGALATTTQQLQHEALRRPAVDRLRLTRRFMPYPQPYPLGPGLLEAQMWLLGKLVSVVNQPTLLQVLEVLLSAVSVKPGQCQVQRAANCTAVAMAALAGLTPLVRRSRSEGGLGDKVASKVLQLASCMLEDQVSDTCLARAGAELMAAATCLGTPALAVNQVKAIAEQLAAEAGVVSSHNGSTQPSSSAELRCVLCLVLGSIFRSRGGPALQTAVPDAVEALVAVASRPTGVTHIWALHGLWLVACAAGVSYAAHVKQTLQLALELVVSSYGDNPLLQPAAAQLANAMVAVLGQQFTLGSLAYSRCKTLVTDNTGAIIAALAAADVVASPEDSGLQLISSSSSHPVGLDASLGLAATCSELELVLFAQQLILFAPGAVPPAKHLPLLLLTLRSGRPTLRKAAAATVWHLADRNAAALAEESIEGWLLAALDAESEASIASQIRDTLMALLMASAPWRPGSWVKLLAAVALAAAPPAVGNAVKAAAATSAALRSATPDDDDDADDLQHNPTPAAAAAAGMRGSKSSPAGAAAEAAVAAAMARLPATPRLRTRLFAAELLLALFAAVGQDSRHRHPQAKFEAPAASEGPTDFLVHHLQTLVDLGFKLTTCPTESLRPSGAQLLQQLLRFFGAVPDPDVPELLLLEQYQAQFVSALRAALKPGSAPALAVCGGTLATSFLSAGLAAGDGAVMRRLMDLLVAPLQVWQALLYGGFAESVGLKARVALLQAHAQCANFAHAFGSNSGGSATGASRQGDSAPGTGANLIEDVIRPGCFSPNGTVNNDLCCSIVVKSQASFMDMLLLLWWGLLLDYVAFHSKLPGVLQGHKSVLFGHMYPEVVEAVKGTFSAAWPAVLIALTSNLPGPSLLAVSAPTVTPDQHAASSNSSPVNEVVTVQDQQQSSREAAWSAFVDLVSSGADLGGSAMNNSNTSAGGAAGAQDKATGAWQHQLQVQCPRMYASLLEVCLMLLSEAVQDCFEAVGDCSMEDSRQQILQGTCHQQQQPDILPAAAVAAARRVAVSLQALQLLVTQQHLQAGLVTADVCCDVIAACTMVAKQLLKPWLQSAIAIASQCPAFLHQQQHLPAQGSKQQQHAPSVQSAVSAVLGDKLFGSALLAACELLKAIAAGACSQPANGQHPASAATGLTAEAGSLLVEALLALSSIAVPYTQTGCSGSHTCSGTGDAGMPLVSMQPAFVWLDSASSNSNPEPQTAQPSIYATAACSSLSRTAVCLLKQQRPEAHGCSVLVWHLALRLVHTAAPGSQLQAAQSLFSACCSTGLGPLQQQQLHREDHEQPWHEMACTALCDAVVAAVQQLVGSNSSSVQLMLPDAAARLPVLLTCALQAAACCSSQPSSMAHTGTAQDRCCGVLLWALQQCHLQQQSPVLEQHAHVACKVLESVRGLLQDAAGQSSQSGQQKDKVPFAQHCAAAVTPQVAVLVHGAVHGAQTPMTGKSLQAVTEGLKVLLLLSTSTAAQGDAAQVAVLKVLIPLLIEVANPPGNIPATPVLRSMACKLVSAMPASSSAAAFRSVVTGLPAASKERLQAALRENATEQTASGAAASSAQIPERAPAVRRPAIQLKMNFQLPTPKAN